MFYIKRLIIRIKSFFLRLKFIHKQLDIPIYFDYSGKFKDKIDITVLNTEQTEKTMFDYSPIIIKVRDNGKIIAKNITFRSGCFLSVKDNGKIEIGNNCFFNTNCYILARLKVKIGDNFLASDNVYIRDNDGHRFSYNDVENKFKAIEIGNNVWLGRNVTILKGVKIGDNVVVGAGSVVTKDVPSNSIIAGNPAKVVKQGNLSWQR